MSHHGLEILEGRVSDLDDPSDIYPSGGLVHPDLARFIMTMRRVTGPAHFDHARSPCASPETADAVLAESVLVRRLGRAAPELVRGPLSDTQYWVRTSPRPGQTTRQAHLNRLGRCRTTSPARARSGRWSGSWRASSGSWGWRRWWRSSPESLLECSSATRVGRLCSPASQSSTSSWGSPVSYWPSC